LKRLKYDESPYTVATAYTDSDLTRLCAELNTLIVHQEDIVMKLAELRRLTASESYIANNKEVRENNNLVKTCLLLEKMFPDLLDNSSALFEYTWLMINVSYLCSAQQANTLKSCVRWLAEALPQFPEHCASAIVNFLAIRPYDFDLVRNSGLFEDEHTWTICRNVPYSVDEIIANFRLFAFVSEAADFDRLDPFEKLVQDYAVCLLTHF
jgi:hypothetical protein